MIIISDINIGDDVYYIRHKTCIGCTYNERSECKSAFIKDTSYCTWKPKITKEKFDYYMIPLINISVFKNEEDAKIALINYT
jgi:hypothetical protein